ncbi:MAG: dUTP diphosphatase [Euryarchaeota archaeon]|nr:dUTP diphosphatase [Euryarchaeota archaeon]MDE1836730.1 dUTP diphosphatase [Euryarchaeota archaeon]MDE1881759.1 dUTP diphosphatase [Euryarchaeota archaeon]MDE2044714.1 dUTP diphosphatase [Thermoplasmata archaeon]
MPSRSLGGASPQRHRRRTSQGKGRGALPRHTLPIATHFDVEIERMPDAPAARVPVKATEDSACFDLYAAHDAELLPGQVTLVRTGLKMRAPPGTFLEIRPRSGLSTKGVIMVNAPGTIDRDYPQEVKVPLSVLFGGPRTLRAGERVAQMRVVPEARTGFRWGRVEATTDREGGFGSTGA